MSKVTQSRLNCEQTCCSFKKQWQRLAKRCCWQTSRAIPNLCLYACTPFPVRLDAVVYVTWHVTYFGTAEPNISAPHSSHWNSYHILHLKVEHLPFVGYS